MQPTPHNLEILTNKVNVAAAIISKAAAAGNSDHASYIAELTKQNIFHAAFLTDMEAGRLPVGQAKAAMMFDLINDFCKTIEDNQAILSA